MANTSSNPEKSLIVGGNRVAVGLGDFGHEGVEAEALNDLKATRIEVGLRSHHLNSRSGFACFSSATPLAEIFEPLM